MLTNDEARYIVEAAIARDENLGESAGGGGHLGYVSYTLDDISVQPGSEGLSIIEYTYTLSVETEFTYYPDNPPQETTRKKRLTVSNGGTVLESEELSSVSPDPPWIDMDLGDDL